MERACVPSAAPASPAPRSCRVDSSTSSALTQLTTCAGTIATLQSHGRHGVVARQAGLHHPGASCRPHRRAWP